MIYNLSKIKKIVLITAITLGLFVVSIILFPQFRSKIPIIKNINIGQKNKDYIVDYYGLTLHTPKKITQSDIEESIKNAKPIEIEGSGIPVIDRVELEKSGWKVVSQINFADGGSFVESIFKDKNTPPIENYFHWDIKDGKNDNSQLKFINTKDICQWWKQIKVVNSISKTNDNSFTDEMFCN